MRFINGNIFVNGQFVPGGFSVAHGRFTHVLAETADGECVDLHGAYVIPGLVDVHTHGNSGADFSDGDYEGLKRMAAFYDKRFHSGVVLVVCSSFSFPSSALPLPRPQRTVPNTSVFSHR